MTPGSPTPDSSRRSQERLGFVSDCQVEVVSPAYTMLAKPLPGKTANITLNGMKLLFPLFPKRTAGTWRKAVDAYERVHVRVDFPTRGGRLVLPGAVVWFQADEGEDPDTVSAAAGILFSVLREAESRALKELLAHLETNYD
ncbi:MAG: PilZ domain-containing protein [Candidatus Sumerlaeia bacterium]|nr:PilZ domain-containing protein [Candidatus Sumerlaeia bacterium]